MSLKENKPAGAVTGVLQPRKSSMSKADMSHVAEPERDDLSSVERSRAKAAKRAEADAATEASSR